MGNTRSILGAASIAIIAGGCVFSTLKADKLDAEGTYAPRTGFLATEVNTAEGQKEFYESMRLNEQGVFSREDLRKSREAVAKFRANNTNRAVSITWGDRGPDNVGGRTRTIIIDPTDQNHIMAGSVTGGLFQSFDAGNTWTRVSTFPVCSISSMAMSDVAPYRILIGTKHLNEPRGNHEGAYESSDGGVTWNFVANSDQGSNGYINEVQAVSGQDKFLIAASGGIKECVAGGAFAATTSAPAGACTSIEISADNMVIIGTFNNITRVSKDGGLTWDNIQSGTGNLINGATRQEYAISHEKVNGDYYVYASLSTDLLVGEFVSTQNGAPGTWSQTAFGSTSGFEPFATGAGTGQGRLDHVIEVYPGRPDKVILGGIDTYNWIMDPGSNPAFGQWYQNSYWGANPTSPIYVHADNHEVQFNDNGDMYIGNDGGIGRSPAVAVGEVFFPSNKGYNVTQFYDIGYNRHGHLIGGSQDNGTQFNDYGNNSFLEHGEVRGGDGFTCDLSQIDDNTMFASLYFGNIERSDDNGSTFNTFFSSKLAACADASISIGSGLGAFRTVGRLWETDRDSTSTDTLLFIPNSSMVSGDTAFINSSTLDQEIFQVLTAPLTVLDTIYPDGTVVQGSTTFNYFLNPVNGDTLDITANAYLTNIALDTLKIQDTYQSWYGLSIASNPNGCSGVWITRDATRFANTPFWWHISNISDAIDIEFSKDGDIMYVGTSDGKLYRVAGLKTLYGNNLDPGYAANDETILPSTVSTTQIYGGNTAVAGIAIDPQDENHVVIALAGTSGAVLRSTTAANDPAATNSGSFTSIMGNLPNMPIFDAMIDRDYANTGLIVLGTDYGVFATDNLATWDDISGDIGCSPVYSVRQNWRGYNEGSLVPGEIYAGTFGRGVWASGSFLSAPAPIQPIANNDFIASLNVYPNPMAENGNVTFDLNEKSDVTLEIYSLTGRKVKTIKTGSLGAGEHTFNINASEFASGTYIINLMAGTSRKTAKFIVNR